MKKLLLLLLFPFILQAQNNNERSRDMYLKVVGKPTVQPVTINSYAVDFVNQKVYRSTSTSASSWIEETNANVKAFYLGSGSRDATVTVGSVTSISGASGSNPVVTITDSNPSGSDATLNFSFTIPAAQKGADGVCPTNCPPNNNVTFTFGATYVFSNGIDDAPAIQRAVDTAYVTGKRIYLVGNLLMGSGVKIPKNIAHLNIEGYATIRAINSNTFTFFYSDVPASASEAESVYTNRRISIKYLVLRGTNDGANQKQTAFNLQALEGGEFAYIWAYNFKRAFDMVFTLRNTIEKCEANACIDGFIVRSGYQVYPDGTLENSSSNTNTLQDNRVVGAPWTNIGVGIYDVSLLKIDGLTLEGGYMNIGLEYVAIATSSTPLDGKRIHFEAASRCGIAVIRITSSTMTHVLDQLNLVKPSILIEVVAYGGGYPNVLIQNVSNQRVYFDDVNPILKSSVGVGWKFDNCDHPFVAYKMTKIFTGVSMTNSCVRENGLSRWCIVNSPN